MSRSITSLVIGLLISVPAVGTSAPDHLDDARALHKEGRLREALDAYSVVVVELTQTDPASAAAARNNACVIRIGFAEYEEALAECSEAVRLRRQLDDPRRLARALNNLGIIQQNLGNFIAASRDFQEALQINRSREDAESQVINLSNLGALEAIEGRFAEAFEHHNRAAALASLHSGSDWSLLRLRIALINQGVVLEKVGAYREALELFQEAQTIRSSADPRQEAQLLINLGVVYRNLGDPVTAVDLFDRAGTLYDILEDRAGIAQTEINLAHAYHLNLARPEEAEVAYRQAHERAIEIGDRPLEIETTFYLGRFLTAYDRLSEARTMFEHCLALSEESGSSEGRWSALAGLAEIAVLNGELDRASVLYGEALDEIDRVRGDLSGPEMRADYFNDKRLVYAKAAQVLADLSSQAPQSGYDEKAFDVVQRAKARTLLDALGRDSSRLHPLSTQELETHLGPKAVLEYFAAERDLLVWAVDESGARLFNLGPVEETLPLVGSIHRSLSSKGEPPEDALITLSNRLLPPAASRLWQSGLLHIAADGNLRRLPFELLRIPGDVDRILIEAVSLSYLPSTSALGLEPNPVQNPQLEVAGFANPRLESDPNIPDSPRERLVQRFHLEPLPGAESELRSLEKWLPQPQMLLTGPEATEQAYRSAISHSPRIAHIATHSVIDDQLGLGTAIVLSPDGTDDGLLFPREIAQQKGSVGLSVLAACRTAADPGRNIDALDTLTGAFLAGGSSAVLATLWDVGDESAAIFLDQFYYRIGRGSSAADALRETKLAMMGNDSWESPALWAGYVLIGDVQPVTPSYWAVSTSTRFVVTAATLAVILVLGNYWRRRRHRD